MTIASLCERFGEDVEFEGVRYKLFPRPETLALADQHDIAACGLGYRTRFVNWVARAVYEGWVDLSELRVQSYERARQILLGKILNKKSFLGIGPKVADCVLLFSCGKYEAFPIDIWISRALGQYYPALIEPRLRGRLEAKRRSSLAPRDYDSISAAARKHFGSYAGYAQQYLYLLSRTHP
jgi:N-glycosylase/DNA lyase